jgi:serine/threonine protein kinase
MLGMNQSGGDLLDKGMYGCIFTDFLTCKREKGNPIKLRTSTPSSDLNHPPLTKLAHIADAENEYEISITIRRLPNWNRYFAVAESICTPALKQKEKDLAKCDALKQYPLSEARILSMTYYGVPLYRHSFPVRDFNIRNFFIHLMEGCSMLTLFGIVHRDLHQGNILVDRLNVPRIIDFNLAVFRDGIEEDMLRHEHNVTISQEPPDSTIVNAIRLTYNPEKVIDSILSKRTILNKIVRVLGVSKEDMKLDMRRFVQASRSVQLGDGKMWFESYWRTIDSWAIGINIVDCLSKFMLWPALESQITALRSEFFPVLKRMCEVNPIERIDCIQALHAIDPQNFVVRTYGKEWMKKVGPM